MSLQPKLPPCPYDDCNASGRHPHWVQENRNKSLYLEEKVLNHGHVILEKWMGSDLDIVNNARVSFNDGSQEMDEKNQGLINFLMREKHGSPFEAVTFRFDIKAPIFVFREWHRHRAGHSYNEWSARYSEIKGEFYVPERDWIREQVGKPGSYTFERVEDDSLAESVQDKIRTCQEFAYSDYEAMLNNGIAKEVARVVLPVGTYSRMKWTTNARALMHFLSLRNSEQAQREIRAYAQIIELMAWQVIPYTMEAFAKHGNQSP